MSKIPASACVQTSRQRAKTMAQGIFMRMFGHPQGVLGRLGGAIMARMNADCGAWTVGLLAVGPNDSVLEVGFGPGVVVQRLSSLASAGHIVGVDASREMLDQ